MKNSADMDKRRSGAAMRTWLGTRGMVIGLLGALLAVLSVVIFGVNAATLLALAVFAILIIAGIIAFSGRDANLYAKTGKTERDG